MVSSKGCDLANFRVQTMAKDEAECPVTTFPILSSHQYCLKVTTGHMGPWPLPAMTIPSDNGAFSRKITQLLLPRLAQSLVNDGNIIHPYIFLPN